MRKIDTLHIREIGSYVPLCIPSNFLTYKFVRNQKGLIFFEVEEFEIKKRT